MFINVYCCKARCDNFMTEFNMSICFIVKLNKEKLQPKKSPSTAYCQISNKLSSSTCSTHVPSLIITRSLNVGRPPWILSYYNIYYNIYTITVRCLFNSMDMHIQNHEIFDNLGNSGNASTIPAECVSAENAGIVGFRQSRNWRTWILANTLHGQGCGLVFLFGFNMKSYLPKDAGPAKKVNSPRDREWAILCVQVHMIWSTSIRADLKPFIVQERKTKVNGLEGAKYSPFFFSFFPLFFSFPFLKSAMFAVCWWFLMTRQRWYQIRINKWVKEIGSVELLLSGNDQKDGGFLWWLFDLVWSHFTKAVRSCPLQINI